MDIFYKIKIILYIIKTILYLFIYNNNNNFAS